MTSRRASLAVAVIALAGPMGYFALAQSSESQVAAPLSYSERLEGAVASHGLGRFGFEAVDDLARAAVVIATVESESELPGTAKNIEGEPHEVYRVVELRIEEVVRGKLQAGARFRMYDFGWMVMPDGDRRPVVADGTRLVVGDRAVVALSGDGEDPNRSGLLTQDAVLFLRDGEVEDTGRTKPIIRELEELTEDELLRRLRTAFRG
jgi:nitrogen regulatory protein PII-like uncharacterized protein